MNVEDKGSAVKACKKLFKRIPKISKRLVIVGLVAIVVVVLLIISVSFYITNPEQFGLEVPFLISCVATVCAATAVVIAIWSLDAMQKSLELTRVTVRPFLTYEAGKASVMRKEKNVLTLKVNLKNTGMVPANVVIAEMAFFDDTEVVEEDNRSKIYPKEEQEVIDALIFPGDAYEVRQDFDLSRDVDKKLYEDMVNGKLKVRFRVMYRAQGREYSTVQTQKLQKAGIGVLGRVPIEPQKWT